MDRAPLFSVVIPSYNRLNFLRQALSSVWAQTYRDYEIIVVDDGSADGTKDYLASVGSSIKMLHKKNSGPAGARNFAVKHAAGNYIAFLDSDDVWPPWTLATFHKLVQRYRPSLICGAVVEFRDVIPNLQEKSLRVKHFPDYLATARQPDFVGSGALAVNRGIFVYAGGFDESLTVAEDHDFFFRVGTAPGFLRVESPVTTAYRRHAGNISTQIDELIAAGNQLLQRESENRYPGGEARRVARWRLLTRVVRPIIVTAFRGRQTRKAWVLYWRCFKMNTRLMRFRFLALAPLMALSSNRDANSKRRGC